MGPGGQTSLFAPEPAPDPLLCWLWLAHVMGPASSHAGRVLDAFGGAQEAWEARDTQEFRQAAGLAAAKRAGQLTPEQYQGLADRCRALGVRILPFDDPDYPLAFSRIPDMPLVLYCTGDPVWLNEPGTVGIVGSRKPTDYGLQAAADIGEALARSGVGALDLIDDDKVCLTNLNRQIIATRKTVGRFKVDVAEERVHDIDPNIKVTTYKTFFGPETQDSFDFSQFDYVVDAIDTVTGKIALVMKCKEAGVPIICSMGAGNKMDPTRFEVTDIYKTSVCPLAKVMRTECRKRRIKHLKVVYSREPVMTPIEDDSISCKYHCICPPGTQRKCTIRRSVPGSNAFVPSVVGLIIGGEVVKDLVGFVPMKG